MSERRAKQRWRTYLGGQAIFNKRCSIYDCIVGNVSDEGVKLVFSAPALLPSAFELSVPTRGETRQVAVVWRSKMEAGVRFLECNRLPHISLEATRKIRALETERDELRWRVNQLSE